ncbi:hypothetical protein G3A_03600 [Bacillus sp. 17376]|nr:hypothetical protein [Mesobacillus boroniphilus]ESU33889.1 hypothetical protein G3A_03600 [Bacillus sp. 17376]
MKLIGALKIKKEEKEVTKGANQNLINNLNSQEKSGLIGIT